MIKNVQDNANASTSQPQAREAIRAAIDEYKNKNDENNVNSKEDRIESRTKNNEEETNQQKKEGNKKEVESVENEIDTETSEIEEASEEVETKKDKKQETEADKKTKTDDKSETKAASKTTEAVEAAQDADKKEKAQKEFVPLGLPKEVRAKWSDIPQEAQLYITKSQKELNDVKAEVGRRMASYRDMDTVLAPYAPQMQRLGVTPAAVVQRLLNYSDGLAGPNKYQVLQQLAGDFGIDLTQYSVGNAQQTQENQDHGQLAQEAVIPQYIDESLYATNQKLDAIINEFVGMKQSQQNVNDKAAEQAVNSWAGLDLSTGQYKNKPYFPYVRQSMYQLIANGTIPVTNEGIDLDAAYDMACYLNPEIRERQTEEAAAKRVKNSASKIEKVNKAKAAGSSFKPGPRIMSSSIETIARNKNQPTAESVRDSLRRAITQINQ